VNNLRTSAVRATALAATVFMLCPVLGAAQESESNASAAKNSEDTLSAVHELQEQVRQLRALMEQMRAEDAQSRVEIEELRQELQTTRGLLERQTSPGQNAVAATVAPGATSQPAGVTSANAGPPSTLEDRVQKLEDSTSLLGEKIDEHYQTKVETASKYRVRLSGIVLMNAFRNVGNADNLDFPNFATPVNTGTSRAAIGATLRQSEIGLEIFGPTVAGAKTTANVQLDFAGGFPAAPNGVNFGIFRLQTASLRFDWQNTSVIAGQDSLFISPLSPISFASLAVPTFGNAGNLWGWIPQIRVEHRFDISDRQTFTVQAGAFDNVNWEPPADPYLRLAQAGERSGQPSYGLRSAWSRPVFDHPLTFGAAGYWGRQDWTWGRYVDAWAGMADWQIPLHPRLTLSGELYRGRGIGGLGAAIGRPVLFGGSPLNISTPIRGLDSVGGWSQLKLQLTSKLEVNGAFAEDNAFAGDVRGFATDQDNFGPILGRNRGMLGNLVYRPRSDLLFSAEFRRFHSFPIFSDGSVTHQVNIAMGILF
jgi:hypothetical protein